MSAVPAQRVEAFSVSTPRNTTKAAFRTTALAFTDGVVVWVEIVIPTGHIGQTGIALAYGGQQVIPEATGAYIVSNGETVHWGLEDFPTGGQWQARTYNLDPTNGHSHYLRFGIREFVAPDNAPVTVPPLLIT